MLFLTKIVHEIWICPGRILPVLQTFLNPASHLALGTTSGAVFWQGRCVDSLQRLEVWPGVAVACLAMAETTDLMLACGGAGGQLAIYRVPRPMEVPG